MSRLKAYLQSRLKEPEKTNSALPESACNRRNHVTSTKSDTYRLHTVTGHVTSKLLINKRLHGYTGCTEKTGEPKSPESEALEVSKPLPWWRDNEAIKARFDEIAAYLEYEHGQDRDSAESQARSCLAQELRGEGLGDRAVRATIDVLRKGR